MTSQVEDCVTGLRVTIVTLSPRHMWPLAGELHRLGSLARLYTGHPSWRVPSDLRPVTRCHSGGVLIAYAQSRLPGRFGRTAWLRLPVRAEFDRWVTRELEPCEVFTWVSGSGLRALQAARSRFGALTVCDVGSTHARYHIETLRNEYERASIPYRNEHGRVLDRVLQEYEAADLITAPSAFVRQTFLDEGISASKVAVVPYGVNTHLFRPGRKLDNRFRAIFVGKLDLRKGVHYLLQALDRLGPRDIDLVLVGPRTEETDAILGPHQGRFRWAGSLPKTRLADLYTQSSVFVLPSVEEGLALVITEAMAAGLPVVATTATGASDLIDDGVEGLIVPRRDPDALADAVGRLYDDPELRSRMGAAARQRIARHHSWAAYATEILSLYRQRLDHARTPGSTAGRWS